MLVPPTGPRSYLLSLPPFAVPVVLSSIMPVRFVYGVLAGAQAIEFIFNITQSAMVKEPRDLEELLDVRSFPVLSLSRCSREVRTFGCVDYEVIDSLRAAGTRDEGTRTYDHLTPRI